MNSKMIPILMISSIISTTSMTMQSEISPAKNVQPDATINNNNPHLTHVNLDQIQSKQYEVLTQLLHFQYLKITDAERLVVQQKSETQKVLFEKVETLSKEIFLYLQSHQDAQKETYQTNVITAIHGFLKLQQVLIKNIEGTSNQ